METVFSRTEMRKCFTDTSNEPLGSASDVPSHVDIEELKTNMTCPINKFSSRMLSSYSFKNVMENFGQGVQAPRSIGECT